MVIVGIKRGLKQLNLFSKKPRHNTKNYYHCKWKNVQVNVIENNIDKEAIEFSTIMSKMNLMNNFK